MNRVRELRYEDAQSRLDGVGGTREAENQPPLRYPCSRPRKHRGRPDFLETLAAEQLSEPADLLLEVRSNSHDCYVSLGDTSLSEVRQVVRVAFHEFL